MHVHPVGPTAVETMSVVADELATRPDGPAVQRLVRIGVPYLHYVRQDHAVEDAGAWTAADEASNWLATPP
jgi:hypothetical protein